MRITVGKGLEKIKCYINKPDSWYDHDQKFLYRHGYEIAIGGTYFLKPHEAKKLHQWLGKALKKIEQTKAGD